MKIIEENLLKKMITQLNNYEKKYQDVKERFTHLEEIEFTSLQELSFEKDNEFFDEVTFILSVITSIIAHPQISNRDEDIIERAEQVGNITNEALKQTIRDASLWKEKDFELVPEYIHYHQHIDDLKIYENIFIGMLIHLIDTELAKYDVFYQRLIPSMQTDALFIEESEKIENNEELKEIVVKPLTPNKLRKPVKVSPVAPKHIPLKDLVDDSEVVDLESSDKND